MNTLKTVLFVIVLASFVGCEEAPTTPETDDCDITITPSSIELEAGLSDTLSSTIKSINGSSCKNKEISWESNNLDIVSIEKIDNKSVEVTAKSEGSTTIQAFNSENNVSTKANVLVTFNPVVTYDVGGINTAVANKFGNEKIITESNEQEIFPDWIKPNKIAYIYFPESTLYSINPEGGSKHTMSKEFGFLQSFDVSKDNSKVVISGKLKDSGLYEIYAKDLNEDTITRLTFEGNKGGQIPGFPNFSPNGQKIAFETYRDGNWEIYTMNADGSNQQNITNTTNQHEGKPSWSKNGDKIAYVSGSTEGNVKTIKVMDSDGSNRLKLASGSYPSWTNDNKIVFSRDERIFSVNPDGSNQKVIVDTPGLKTTPSWKPEN